MPEVLQLEQRRKGLPPILNSAGMRKAKLSNFILSALSLRGILPQQRACSLIQQTEKHKMQVRG